MSTRVDLHCHSKYSDRTDEWLLRAVKAPESVMEPLEIYRLCRRRGMGFVTISDHDRIAGALEIAHLPGAFVSCEVTVAFPEDGCEIHCLALGISEEQHREIDRLRGDLYAFRDYTWEQGIVTSVAHPFYRVNDLLTIDHLEKLLLLFERFEARNGIHDGGGNALVEKLLAGLGPEDVERMAGRQDLAPRGVRPWAKHVTGGSDDHGGLYLATTWTETPDAADVPELLGRLRTGASAPGGAGGSTHRLAQSIYAIADGWCEQRLGASKDPFRATLRRLGVPEGERPRRWFPLPGLPFGRPPAAAGSRAAPPPSRTQRLADRALRKGVRRFLFHAARHLRRGNLAGGLGALSHLAPAAAALLPWLFAVQAQHKDAALLRHARLHFTGGGGGAGRKAWVTDTFGDVNGVARTVETVARRAAAQGRPLTIVTCRGSVPPALGAAGLEVANLRPLLELPLPGYESQLVALPSVLEVYRELEALGADEVMFSTPGPLGVVALTAARMLGVRCTGIYHTDFPAYVRHLLGPGLEDAAWGFMRWFYGDMDRVFVRSRAYRDLLAEHGFDAARLHLMPRAADTGLFRPERRDPAFWHRPGTPAGAAEPVRFLYVGRVSKEKGLDALFAAFDLVRSGGRDAELAVVGDGPYRTALEREVRGRRDVRFTGVLHGDELATAYASADVFVFPSLTDTLGNAVLEAQASGLPVVVSDRGGPQELVRDGITGLVARGGRAEGFAAAMARLHDDTTLRRAMGKQAVEAARRLSWDGFLAELWRREPAAAHLDEVAAAVGGGRVARFG